MIRKVLLTTCVVSSLAAMKQVEPLALDERSSARKTGECSDEARGLSWRLARAVSFYIRDGAPFDRELIESLCKEGADQGLVLEGYDWGISGVPHFKGSVSDYVNYLCVDSNEAIQTRAVEVKFDLLAREDRAAVKSPKIKPAQVRPGLPRATRSCTPLFSFVLLVGGSVLVMVIQACR